MNSPHKSRLQKLEGFSFDNNSKSFLGDINNTKCQTHKKRITSVCVDPFCTQKILCCWESIQHEHPKKLYRLREIQDPLYLQDLFSAEDFKPQDYRETIDKVIQYMKSNLEVLLQKFKTKIEDTFEREIDSSVLFSKRSELTLLDQRWRETGTLNPLLEFVSQLDNFLVEQFSNGQSNDMREEIKRLESLLNQNISQAELVHQRICQAFSEEISNFDSDKFDISILPYNKPNLRELFKINKFSISETVSYQRIKTPVNIQLMMGLLRRISSGDQDFMQLNEETGVNKFSRFNRKSMLNEDLMTSNARSLSRRKDWNFGLSSKNTLGKVSLPGTVVFDGDEQDLIKSEVYKREIELVNANIMIPSVEDNHVG